MKTIDEVLNCMNVQVRNAHEMHLAVEPFEKIKRGEKTMEVRLYDDKRKEIKIGDGIVFYKGESLDEKISVTVTNLYRFDSFLELFESDLAKKTGYADASPEEAAKTMRRFYSEKQEKKFGVLAIEIKSDSVDR